MSDVLENGAAVMRNKAALSKAPVFPGLASIKNRIAKLKTKEGVQVKTEKVTYCSLRKTDYLPMLFFAVLLFLSNGIPAVLGATNTINYNLIINPGKVETVPVGDTWIVAINGSITVLGRFEVEGRLENYGGIQSEGVFDTWGPFYNYGVLTNGGGSINTNIIYNTGFIWFGAYCYFANLGSGQIWNVNGQIESMADFVNSGLVYNGLGSSIILYANGEFYNNAGGDIRNDASFLTIGLFQNDGLIANSSSFEQDLVGDLNNRATGVILNQDGGNFYNAGIINNDGQIENEVGGQFTNNDDGEISTSAAGSIVNWSSFDNQGELDSFGSFENMDNAHLQNSRGNVRSFQNALFLNDGTVENDGGLLNDGFFRNAGAFDNRQANAFYNFCHGTFRNDGTFDNTGPGPKAWNGGMLINSGTWLGAAPATLNCGP